MRFCWRPSGAHFDLGLRFRGCILFGLQVWVGCFNWGVSDAFPRLLTPVHWQRCALPWAQRDLSRGVARNPLAAGLREPILESLSGPGCQISFGAHQRGEKKSKKHYSLLPFHIHAIPSWEVHFLPLISFSSLKWVIFFVLAALSYGIFCLLWLEKSNNLDTFMAHEKNIRDWVLNTDTYTTVTLTHAFLQRYKPRHTHARRHAPMHATHTHTHTDERYFWDTFFLVTRWRGASPWGPRCFAKGHLVDFALHCQSTTFRPFVCDTKIIVLDNSNFVIFLRKKSFHNFGEFSWESSALWRQRQHPYHQSFWCNVSYYTSSKFFTA